ncbi:ATP-binding protein [candidate division KSB1 bacterium]|nr:ATP-binding protein [candidate division KSB1 bacterium]MCH7753597.1 ATP-binding protein [candidate division KSB1 bacterium]MCH8872029.1 ATP-binding protein [candidate division KSB1 bacterium]MCH8953844.1 ATP-binding protein [candidate division KSB1 bacterium]MCH8980927.1 ATP-binding protein [candidate division KSB1 bacterium]
MPKTQKEYQLKIPSQSDNLAIIRDVVAKVASRVGFDTDEASKIELAVDEACTNVIKHAYANNSNQMIEVSIKVDQKKLIIIVADKGKGFNPDEIKLPDLNKSIKEGRKGGLGLCLIKTLMDKVEFEIKPGSKTQVKMIKYIS